LKQVNKHNETPQQKKKQTKEKKENLKKLELEFF
jgi:hypothetical protein